MICHHCGISSEPGASFCTQCGRPLEEGVTGEPKTIHIGSRRGQERLEALKSRIAYLEKRVSEIGVTGLHHRRRELSALKWAIEIIEGAPGSAPQLVPAEDWNTVVELRDDLQAMAYRFVLARNGNNDPEATLDVARDLANNLVEGLRLSWRFTKREG